MKRTVSQTSKQSVRIVSLTLVVCAFFCAAASLEARAKRVRNLPVIRVVVYNYADVPRLELRVAEHQTASLLADAKVRTVWREYSGKALSSPSGTHNLAQDFCLRILHASTIKRPKWISGPYALGQSIIPPGIEAPVPGGSAIVFYDRVKDVSSLSALYPGEVLGEAIAHELGHLLLGPRHARQGIMKANWNSQDLKLINRSQLRFSLNQAAALQRAVQSLQKNRSLTVAAQR